MAVPPWNIAAVGIVHRDSKRLMGRRGLLHLMAHSDVIPTDDIFQDLIQGMSYTIFQFLILDDR
jgi:hypothetical protein